MNKAFMTAVGALMALGTISFGVATLMGCSEAQTAEWEYPIRLDIWLGTSKQVNYRNSEIGTENDRLLRYTYDGSTLEVRYRTKYCENPMVYPNVYTWYETREEYGDCMFVATFPNTETR